MAAPATTTAPEVAQVNGGSTPQGKKLWKLIALGFMVAVIGAECVVALVYVSTSNSGQAADAGAASDTEGHEEHGDQAAEDPPAPAEETHGHDEASHADHDAEAEEAAEGDHGQGAKTGEVEVDLGQYSLTAFQPASNSTLLVDFHLYGTVRAEDEGAFQGRFEKHKHRIRDQVIVTVRSAEMADFADPGLGLLKRQILEKSNSTLGKRLVRGVVFSDFTLIEQ